MPAHWQKLRLRCAPLSGFVPAGETCPYRHVVMYLGPAEKDGVPLHLSTEVERADYEGLIQPLLDRTMDAPGMQVPALPLTSLSTHSAPLGHVGLVRMSHGCRVAEPPPVAVPPALAEPPPVPPEPAVLPPAVAEPPPVPDVPPPVTFEPMHDFVDMLQVCCDAVQFEHALPELPHVASVSLSAVTQTPALQQPVQLFGPHEVVG